MILFQNMEIMGSQLIEFIKPFYEPIFNTYSEDIIKYQDTDLTTNKVIVVLFNNQNKK
jgi:hypothetical protein